VQEEHLSPVPDSHRSAAAEVCAHLVACRGGGAFLSSADAALLVRWLDEGRPVTGILIAIEQAAASRRKRRSRAPLTLGKVARHLKALHPGALATTLTAPTNGAQGAHPLSEAVQWALQAGRTRLAEALAAIEGSDADTLVRAAAEKVREDILWGWEALASDLRAARLAEARRELEDLDLGYDAHDLDDAAAEFAYDEYRQQWQPVETRALWAMLRGGSP
jgi:hypothetical protein